MLKGQKIVAFGGLADNVQFFDALRQTNCRLVQTLEYADHHQYDRSDLDCIAAVADEQAADRVVTTLKDFVKIQAFENIPMGLVVVDVTIQVVGNDDRLIKTIITGNKTALKEP